MAGQLKAALDGVFRVGVIATPKRPNQLREAELELRRSLGPIVPRMPGSYELLATYKVLRRIQRNDHSFSALSSTHIRRSPWVLFQTFDADDETAPLVQDASFLTRYLETVSEHARVSSIITLLHVFFLEYPQGAACFDALRLMLRRELEQGRSVRLANLRQQCEDFALLENDGPGRFGDLLARSDSYPALMADAGLTGELSEKGFVVPAIERLLGRVAQLLDTITDDAASLAAQIRAFTVFMTAETNTGGLRWPSLRPALADSLLMPFASRAPDRQVREVITSFLLDFYGDPRLSSGRWHGVSDAAQAVLKRWLVRTTLRDFFRLVSKATKGDAEADRMWKYRQAFWEAYLDRGVIFDAWVILGKEIRQRGKYLLEAFSANSYAALTPGYSVKPTHAVLLLRIGGLVIAEWSHSGAYRVWLADNPESPPFYLPRYSRPELVHAPDFEGPHSSPSTGAWQRRLAADIRKHTSIDISARQYMPDA